MSNTPLHREDLIRIRRSLALTPSLPGDEAQVLLAEIERLLRDRRATAAEVDTLAAAVDALRRRLAE